MDPSLPGMMQTLAVAVRQFEISSRARRGFCPACPQQYNNILLQCIRGTGIFLYWCKDMRDERWIRRCLG